MADFALLGEGLALDLANTLVREHGAAVDLLARRGAAAAWCAAHADALPGGRVPAAGLAALRDAVHETLDAAARRRRPDAAALALVDASAAAVRPKLRATPHGPVVAWTGPRAGGARALGAIARDAQAVLADPHAEVRACANPDCVLLFVARDGRRRFCTTAICSNRVRQARHRARHRAGTSA